jgi:hypothetical protein
VAKIIFRALVAKRIATKTESTQSRKHSINSFSCLSALVAKIIFRAFVAKRVANKPQSTQSSKHSIDNFRALVPWWQK